LLADGDKTLVNKGEKSSENVGITGQCGYHCDKLTDFPKMGIMNKETEVFSWKKK